MPNAWNRVAPVAAVFAAIGCGDSSPREQSRTPVEAASPALREALPVPKPIPGGDPLLLAPPFNPQFHQFLPGKTFDGEWVEPNGITDFFGTVAQVYLGGKATDAVTGAVFDVEVDTRVYQGVFVDVDGKTAHGTFCEIWFDLYDPGSGSQLHDFSPGNGESLVPPVTDPIFHLPGLFWMIRLDEGQFLVSDGGRKASLEVTNQLEFDRFQFLGPGNVTSHLTFHIDYARDPGPPALIRPTSPYPESGFDWAGEMWNAKATGTFSVWYDDPVHGKLRVTGQLDSRSTQTTRGIELPFGHMGVEANGVFTHVLNH